MKSSNKSIPALLKINLAPIDGDLKITDKKGEPFTFSVNALFSVDYRSLVASVTAFDTAVMEGIVSDTFAGAVSGEYHFRELAALNAEAQKLIDCDDAFFAEALETYDAETVKAAKAKADEAKRRIDFCRDYITTLAHEATSITVKAIVSAIRSESMPATLAKPAEAVRAEAKTLREAADARFTTEELQKAREIIADKDGFSLDDVAKAERKLFLEEISNGIDQRTPNLKELRSLITTFIRRFWVACPAEGVNRINLECNHGLSVDVFSRIKNARALDKKGKAVATFADADAIAKEVVLAVVEHLQAKAAAKAEAAKAEADKAAKAAKAEAKAAEAKAKAEAAKAAAKAEAEAKAEAAKAEAKAAEKAAEKADKAAKAAAKAAEGKGTKAAKAKAEAAISNAKATADKAAKAKAEAAEAEAATK